MTTQKEFLKSIPYFSDLSEDELDPFVQLTFERTAERGEVILLEGEPAEALFFVASGVVKIFKTSTEGKEQILGIARPRESFNEVPVFDDGPNPASVQAMGPVALFGMRKDGLRATLENRPQVALNIIKILAERVRQLVSLVEDLSFRHVIERVARILLENAENGLGPGRRLTQQEMAAMAGTTREVVGRSLKALEEEGAIKLDHHRIVITDKEALKNIAEISY
jgi:CRP/FNR family transcriptional regulator